MTRPVLHHIPVCPFSQRVEILLELKGRRDAVEFSVVDVTRPRDPALLAKTRGATALPILDLADGRILKESLVLLRYFEDLFPTPMVARADPYERAVENMLIALEGDFVAAGYRFVMSQDKGRREALAEAMTAQYQKLDDFLSWQAPGSEYLFDRFGLAECVYAPIFVRFWFLDYYEGYDIPEDFARVRRWRDACLAHPAAQQVSYEEVVKSYYDYAWGAGNGDLLPGRARSSFAFLPHWRERPWPPRGKEKAAGDAELGLVQPCAGAQIGR
ncbi:glutathione S-transferase family protein [Aestuariivirga sp.]|uniref:glutathione S-transferase family protein n=1 Tax=Aestuariivirga sp. TaxID=2650926 RepID=UPI00391C9038